jgi:outer membrane cobalamin receptor
MPKTNMITVIFALILLCAAPSFPQSDLSSEIKDPELDQEMAWLKAETYVITASRVRENIKKAAASITVITDRQIRQMGARDLSDALLRSVPGFRAAYFHTGERQYRQRGGGGSFSNRFLLMLNGHPVNNAGTGGFSWLHDTLIVDNVKRIEFVRGSASALYGANAFNGVINIITKEADDIDGVELTARGGSYDTQQYNLLYGKTFSDLEVAFNFNYFKTNGFRGLIEEDF